MHALCNISVGHLVDSVSVYYLMVLIPAWIKAMVLTNARGSTCCYGYQFKYVYTGDIMVHNAITMVTVHVICVSVR